MNIVAHAKEPDLSEQLKQHGDEGNTAQGLYIVGADGKLYGWINNHNVDEVQKFLQRGLAEYQNHPPSRAQIQQSTLNEHFSMVPDPGTSVIRVFTRVHPVPRGSDELNNGIGRDHFWILRDELQQIASLPHDDGRPFLLPSSLVARMVRFHLIDNVRGEPDMWRPEEVKQKNFSARFVGGNASAKFYEFQGEFDERTSDGKRGVQGIIEGRFEVAMTQLKISHFRAFAQMKAWGASRFTPGAPAGQFPLLAAMVGASDQVSQVVPPQALYEWSEYYLNPK